MRLTRLSASGYELTLERQGLVFEPGMLISIHGDDPTMARDYTIASGTADETLQILFRHVQTGRLTARLSALREGEAVRFTGPYGAFTVRDPSRPLVFVATGTGIAPCRSYNRSIPGLDLTVFHGARSEEELYYRDAFAACPYHPCISGPEGGTGPGRVTEALADAVLPRDAHYYLCGAYEMIFDAGRLLQGRGIGADAIFTEAYYYKSG